MHLQLLIHHLMFHLFFCLIYAHVGLVMHLHVTHTQTHTPKHEHKHKSLTSSLCVQSFCSSFLCFFCHICTVSLCFLLSFFNNSLTRLNWGTFGTASCHIQWLHLSIFWEFYLRFLIIATFFLIISTYIARLSDMK